MGDSVSDAWRSVERVGFPKSFTPYRKAMNRLQLENITSLRRIYRDLEELEYIDERIIDERT